MTGSLIDGHEVLVRAGPLEGITPFGIGFHGSKFKPIDAPSGSEICPSLLLVERQGQRPRTGCLVS